MGTQGPVAPLESATAQARFDGLDGVRGLAALAIVLSHVGLYTGLQGDIAGGEILRRLDIGVPVFFVLSGFLIYRPFVVARVAGRRTSLAPYARARALRLLPAYWVALGVVAAVPWLAHLVPSVDAVSSHGWWRYFGLLQIYRADTAGLGFAHAWTLCTEMSFYVAVPIWAWLMARSIRTMTPRREIVMLLGVGLLSWGLRELTFARPAVIGGWFPFGLSIGGTFLWFSIGMSAAVGSVLRGTRSKPPLSPGHAWSAAAVLFLLLAYAAGLPHSLAAPSAEGFMLVHGGYALIGALLVLPFTGSGASFDDLVGRVLTSRPMRRLGEVSYGVYLWHPVLIVALLKIGIAHRFSILAPATIAGAMVMGTLSYELVERPARRLRGQRSVARPRSTAESSMET